jgi:aminopeptidase N
MKDLEVYNSTIKISSSTDADFSELKGLKWDYDAETSFLTISLLSEGQVFRAGNNYTFESEYKGFSKNDNIGFYRTLYTDDNGVKKYAVTSQLEYIEARKSFLSFDEPELKSTFSITIIHEENLHAMSNMPISKKTNM